LPSNDVNGFFVCYVQVAFLFEQILFRGAVSIGQLYKVDPGVENTVVGPGVSDAAAWHDRADWIGILATRFIRSTRAGVRRGGLSPKRVLQSTNAGTVEVNECQKAADA
jgi:hypothetical protein